VRYACVGAFSTVTILPLFSLSPTAARYLAGIRRPYHLAAAVFLAVVGILLFGPYLWTMPEGIHVWPQTDRLSLAVNFYDFGFQFWYPRTSTLFSIGGITGVEFPIQPYLAALGGLIFGRDNILACFRALDGAMAVLGCWYLFRLVFERTGSFVAGLLPGAFMLTAPTYAFYAGSTLPDPFSFSLLFVGYYYWLRYFDTSQQFADLLKAFAVLTLATLIKTTIGLHLGAVAGITLLYALLQPTRFTHRQRLLLLLTWGVGAGLVVGFYLHNQHLNKVYQSGQFLATVMPAEGADTWHEYLRLVRTTWLYEYLTRTQYRVVLACLVLCLWLARRAGRQFPRLVMLLAANLAIALLFYQLMGAQMAVHDYYAICSFLPPVLLVLLLALLLGVPLVKPGWPRYVAGTGMALLVGYLSLSSFRQLAGRMSDDHPPASLYYTHRWMRGGAAFLKEARVPLRARILVLEDYSPNMGLVYFDRRGMSMNTYLPNTKVAEIVQYMSADSLQYVVMKPEAYARLAQEGAVLSEAFAPVLAKPSVVVLRRRHPEQLAW
jgi:hypothetical protein